MPDHKPFISASEIAAMPTRHIRHVWNPNSDVHLTPLSEAAGMKRVIVSLGRVPPGKESFVYHAHEHDEEFLFVISGHGRAENNGEHFEVGPGDFMGFTAPGIAHHLTNPYGEDLVYLMGGERSAVEIGHFPKLGRRILFGPAGIYAVDDKALEPMPFEAFVVKD